MDINHFTVQELQWTLQLRSADQGQHLLPGDYTTALCFEWRLGSQHEELVVPSEEGNPDSREMTKTIMIRNSRKWSRNFKYFINTFYQTGHITLFVFNLRENA